MPRDVSGNYTLPTGNPVANGAIIDIAWANPTMADIASQLNNVPTRDGSLGLLAPLEVSTSLARMANLNTTSATGGGVRFTNSGIINGYIGSAKYTVAGGALADFSIDTAGANNLILGTNDVERMRVDPNGNVGIGTTAPGAKTEISVA